LNGPDADSKASSPAILEHKMEESNLIQHARREYKALGWMNDDGTYNDDMQEMICEQIIQLLNLFSEHGHSGFSAPYALQLFEKLAKFEPIGPLTGVDSEWNECSDGIFQNNRCSHVFKNKNRFNGQAYDINAIVFYDVLKDEDGAEFKSHFTNWQSHQPITFPYTPTTEYRERSVEHHPV
jgi:hypothetical protein